MQYGWKKVSFVLKYLHRVSDSERIEKVNDFK